MSDTKTVQLGFRVNPEKARQLEELARATDRPRSWLLEQALDGYLAAQAWQTTHIEQGLKDARAGRTVPHEQVRDWLQSWGNDDETDPPQ